MHDVLGFEYRAESRVHAVPHEIRDERSVRCHQPIELVVIAAAHGREDAIERVPVVVGSAHFHPPTKFQNARTGRAGQSIGGFESISAHPEGILLDSSVANGGRVYPWRDEWVKQHENGE